MRATHGLPRVEALTTEMRPILRRPADELVDAARANSSQKGSLAGPGRESSLVTE